VRGDLGGVEHREDNRSVIARCTRQATPGVVIPDDV